MGDERTHILVIEDTKDDQMRYFYDLNRMGYRVTEANDGAEGIEKASQLAPDLILLDLWLAKMSGWEVLDRLKANKTTAKIPILVVSGEGPGNSEGSDPVLRKPISVGDLGAAIARKVSRSTSNRLQTSES